MLNEEMLLRRINDLYGRLPASDFERTKNQSNIEAIQSFRDFYRNININDLEPGKALSFLHRKTV